MSVGMGWRSEDLCGQAKLNEPPGIHDPNAGTDGVDHGQVVADEHHGQPELLAQAHEQIQNLGLKRDIERGDRLIRDQYLGPHRQCSGDLALAVVGLRRARVDTD